MWESLIKVTQEEEGVWGGFFFCCFILFACTHHPHTHTSTTFESETNKIESDPENFKPVTEFFPSTRWDLCAGNSLPQSHLGGLKSAQLC